MESLVALGFAANVVQFAEFSSKLLSEAIRIYRTKPQISNSTLCTDLVQVELQLERYARPIELDKSVRDELDGNVPEKETSGLKWFFKKSQNVHQSPNFGPDVLDADFERQERLDPTKTARLSACDRDILRICLECQEVTTSLQQALAKLRSSKTTLWTSFLDALRTVWSEDDIDSLRQKLDSFRQQMTVLLLVSVR